MTTSPLPTRYSDELDDKEILQFSLILYEIARKQDFVELSRFIKLTSTVIGPNDFNLLLRNLVRMMGNSKCGESLCSDWVMTQLYELYRAIGC